jgi:VWFA-related protein
VVADGRRTGAQDPQQPPMFRSGATEVAVDVTVRDASRRVLTDLTAKDFIVQDNGVAQDVDDVSYGRVPIDVTVGLDISRSVDGPLLDRLRTGVSQLMRDLKKDDRLKLMLFNMRFNRTIDFTSDTTQIDRAMHAATAGGGTALFDALSVAMITASDPNRRQLVVFFTDGSDTSSITTGDALIKVAERSRATVSFVLLPTASAGPQKSGVQSTANANVPPILQSGAASQSVFAMEPALHQIMTDSGGTMVPVTTGGLGPTFLQILDRFRSAYVLFYSPKGVDRAGFHAISVTVNRPGVTVEARRGYFGR